MEIREIEQCLEGILTWIIDYTKRGYPSSLVTSIAAKNPACLISSIPSGASSYLHCTTDVGINQLDHALELLILHDLPHAKLRIYAYQFCSFEKGFWMRFAICHILHEAPDIMLITSSIERNIRFLNPYLNLHRM